MAAPSSRAGALDLIVPKPGGGGTVAQQRWCAVKGEGFHMFAPNRIPKEGEEPEHLYGWRELIDARLDKMPPGHGREERCCFTISVGLARHEEATLTFVDQDREHAEQWVQCLHAGMDRAWGGPVTAPAKRSSQQPGTKTKFKDDLCAQLAECSAIEAMEPYEATSGNVSNASSVT